MDILDHYAIFLKAITMTTLFRILLYCKNWGTIMKAKITYTANYLPENILTNADLEKTLDTNNEWIVSRTGIEERHIANANENACTMAMSAIANLKNKGADLSDVDAIVVSTTTKNYLSPSTASLIQTALGLNSCMTFDLSAACSGYIFGLNTITSMIESGAFKKVLFVASEKLSVDTDWENRGTAILFGDACSVAVLEANDVDDSGVVEIDMEVEQRDILAIKSSGSACPITEEAIDNKEDKIHMEGSEVFKLAVTRFKSSILKAIEKSALKLDDIKLMIPHQANLRIIKALAREMDLSLEKVMVTVQKYGNTSASSIGLALTDAIEKGLVKKGDYVLMSAFGAGLTYGTTIIKL